MMTASARDDLPRDGRACFPIGRCDAPGAGTFFAAVDGCAGGDDFVPETTARDDGVIFFTSGTGDRPKGVVLSYREQLGNIEPMTEGFGITGCDRIYDFRSFNWASAQLLGVLAPLCRGATLVMAKKFSATRFFDDVRAHGVTVAAGNPTVINMLLGTAAPVGAKDLPTLRFITSSSAPLLAAGVAALRGALRYSRRPGLWQQRDRLDRRQSRTRAAVRQRRPAARLSPARHCRCRMDARCRRARSAMSNSAPGTTTNTAISATTAPCG